MSERTKLEFVETKLSFLKISSAKLFSTSTIFPLLPERNSRIRNRPLKVCEIHQETYLTFVLALTNVSSLVQDSYSCKIYWASGSTIWQALCDVTGVNVKPTKLVSLKFWTYKYAGKHTSMAYYHDDIENPVIKMSIFEVNLLYYTIFSNIDLFRICFTLHFPINLAIRPFAC